MSGLKVSVIDSMDAFKELRTAWSSLLSDSRSNTIFLTWEWLYSWAETYMNRERQLFILAIYDDKDELRGLAPWYIQNSRSSCLAAREIHFLGTPNAGSDYVDLIIKKGQEQNVTLCIYNFLLKEGSPHWDYCLLNDVPATSLFLLHFLNKTQDDGKYAEIRPASYCPIVPLRKSSEDFFAMLSPNRRQQFRRHLRLLQKKAAIEHFSCNGMYSGSDLDDFFKLYSEKNEHYDSTVYSFMTAFSSKFSETSPIQIDLLRADGRTIAGLFHIRHLDTLYMYLMAVDKEYDSGISIGNILVGMCISKAIDNGFNTYDFLKGIEPYKFHWAEAGNVSLTLFFPQRKIIPWFIAVNNFVKAAVKVAWR